MNFTMTAKQKSDATIYISVTTLITVLGIFWYVAQWMAKTDNRLEQLEQHTKNEVLHMSLEKRINLFVPRVEIESNMKAIREDLKDIKSQLRELNKTK